MGLIIRGVGTTSSRLRDWCARLPRVARRLATLGFDAESLWDSCRYVWDYSYEESVTTSSRLRDWCARLPGVARCLATLGFVAESLWDSCWHAGFKSSEGDSR